MNTRVVTALALAGTLISPVWAGDSVYTPSSSVGYKKAVAAETAEYADEANVSATSDYASSADFAASAGNAETSDLALNVTNSSSSALGDPVDLTYPNYLVTSGSLKNDTVFLAPRDGLIFGNISSVVIGNNVYTKGPCYEKVIPEVDGVQITYYPFPIAEGSTLHLEGSQSMKSCKMYLSYVPSE